VIADTSSTSRTCSTLTAKSSFPSLNVMYCWVAPGMYSPCELVVVSGKVLIAGIGLAGIGIEVDGEAGRFYCAVQIAQADGGRLGSGRAPAR
jgi:hypothetical protein